MDDFTPKPFVFDTFDEFYDFARPLIDRINRDFLDLSHAIAHHAYCLSFPDGEYCIDDEKKYTSDGNVISVKFGKE